MSIRMRGRWPDEPGTTEPANLDHAVEETENAVYEAIDAAHQAQQAGLPFTDALTRELARTLDTTPRATVTVEDGLAMVLQSVEDTGTSDTGHRSWDGYEALIEGIRDHSLYHLARPGECGQNCPAYITFALEEVTPE